MKSSLQAAKKRLLEESSPPSAVSSTSSQHTLDTLGEHKPPVLKQPRLKTSTIPIVSNEHISSLTRKISAPVVLKRGRSEQLAEVLSSLAEKLNVKRALKLLRKYSRVAVPVREAEVEACWRLLTSIYTTSVTMDGVVGEDKVKRLGVKELARHLETSGREGGQALWDYFLTAIVGRSGDTK